MRSLQRWSVILSFVVGIFGCAQTSTSGFKPNSEPDGFAGINWGTQFSEVKSDMVESRSISDPSEPDVKIKIYYTKKWDNLKMGEAQLDRIEYVFWRGKFAEARITATGAENFVSKLAEAPLANIRIHQGDARDIIEALPDSSLGRVFILFPDPWPKTRHHKRRFVQMEMLDALARVMKPGGELRIASDDAGYVAWTLERTMAHPDFAWTAETAADWKTRPPDWPETRYEAKALHGPPGYLRFVRRDKIASWTKTKTTKNST